MILVGTYTLLLNIVLFVTINIWKVLYFTHKLFFTILRNCSIFIYQNNFFLFLNFLISYFLIS